ncbi:MAG: hypothetical protein AAGE59_32890 [Cyanobacteria bacterium P01_F01_bin.86]
MKTKRNDAIKALLASTFALSLVGLLPASGLTQEADTPTNSWQRILDFLTKERQDSGSQSQGVSRGSICPVSFTEEAVLWHTRPLLVWQGQSFPSTGIRQTSPDLPVWVATATETEAGIWQMPYTGTALEPGIQYEWLFYFMGSSNPDSPVKWVQFQVLAAEERDRIAADLANLEAQLQEADEETIALARADYFIANGLSADALQEIFAVSDPSEVLLETRSAIVQATCGDSAN